MAAHTERHDDLSVGCMTYGSPDWQPWILGEKETFEHIKYACVVHFTTFQAGLPEPRDVASYSFDNGINTFDTANAYSNGESETLLGKALKHFKIPREEVVILTKVHQPPFNVFNWDSRALAVLSRTAGWRRNHGRGP